MITPKPTKIMKKNVALMKLIPLGFDRYLILQMTTKNWMVLLRTLPALKEEKASIGKLQFYHQYLQYMVYSVAFFTYISHLIFIQLSSKDFLCIQLR